MREKMLHYWKALSTIAKRGEPVALITRYLVIDMFDNVYTVKYDRDQGVNALKEWRASGGSYALLVETSILARPEYTQERVLISFNDPITDLN